MMETPENVDDEYGGDETWEHPYASGLESSSCFPPSVGVVPCDELMKLSPSSCGGSPMNGCQWVTILGHLGGCIYVLGVPWGVLHLALHEILLGREANLVSIKFAVLSCQRHISHVWTPNNANSVSRLCATKLSSTLVFISFLRTEDKIFKSALEDNMF
jgi:hypothetical protein